MSKYKINNEIKLDKENQKTFNLKENKPIIYTKKAKNQSKIIPLNLLRSDIGQTKHFPPAAQEWLNSIYTYNNNYIKSLPIADKNLMDLLKSYFNFQLNEGKYKSKSLPIRYKRLSVNRIFVGKGELKHTSSKVIITIYIYNKEKKILNSVLKSLLIDLQFPKKQLTRSINVDKNSKEIITYNRPHTLEEYLELPEHYINYFSSLYSVYLTAMIKTLDRSSMYYSLLAVYYNKLTKLVDSKVMTKEEKHSIFNDKLEILKFNTYTPYNNTLKNQVKTKIFGFEEKVLFFKDFRELVLNKILGGLEKRYNQENSGYVMPSNGFVHFSLFYFKYSQYFDFKSFMSKMRQQYMKNFYSYLHTLLLNKAKFDISALSDLRRLVSNIYNKEVEFNFVNLKKLHLNSDIFTQVVSLKLKNRDNRIYKVLKLSLAKVEIPNFNRLNEKYNSYNKEDTLVNIIRNAKINSLFVNKITEKDPLNKILLNIFPLAENLNRVFKTKLYNVRRPISLENFILRSLKHIDMAGVRIEAKGRLTRRFTASKSIFKMRWKGGLKNVDSSYRGLSAVMLRGHAKSNIQYTVQNRKGRNGAFGVKGWVSNK